MERSIFETHEYLGMGNPTPTHASSASSPSLTANVFPAGVSICTGPVPACWMFCTVSLEEEEEEEVKMNKNMKGGI